MQRISGIFDMKESSPLFAIEEQGIGMRLAHESDSIVHHEVMFEEDQNRIYDRPLFLGTAFAKKRFLFTALCIGAVFCLLVGRAAWMQLYSGKQYVALAEQNRLREAPIWPRRGIIRDRHQTVLVDNVSQFQVTMLPSALPKDPEQRSTILGKATRLLGMSINDLLPIASTTGTKRDQVAVIAHRVPYERAMAFAVALPDLTGFNLEVRALRRYPYSKETQSLSHLLGYVGRLSQEEYEARRDQGYFSADEIGKTGIERSYEPALRGTVGARMSEVDARGKVKALVGDTPAVDGRDLALSLDLQLQRAAETALRAQMELSHIERGSAIAMDPRNGEILAMVSLPAFDNNTFSGGVSSTVYQQLAENPNHPLYPRAWAGIYPSGSTVKIVVSAAALMEGIITPQTVVHSVGGLRVGPWFFPDWKAGGHGTVNTRGAIAWSVNTFYYMIGGGYESFLGLGVDRLTKWYRTFGLGEKTGIDLPAESAGFVPSKEWKQTVKGERWFVGDTYNLSIGQGDLLVTPLQVAVYTSAIANRGTITTPHIVIGSGSSTKSVGIPADMLDVVRAGMRDNVVYGTGRSLSTLPFPAAGKTGTAQWSSTKATHAWFTSFAPFDQPEIAVTVMLEEGGEGSAVSVPVAKSILQSWWNLKQNRGGKF